MSTGEMTKELYNVVLTGKTLNDAAPEAAVADVARLMQLNPQQVAEIFAKAPIAIKTNMDEIGAQKIQYALQSLNIEVLLEAVSPNTTNTIPVGIVPTANDSPKPIESYGYTFCLLGTSAYALLQIRLQAERPITVDQQKLVCADPHIVFSPLEVASTVAPSNNISVAITRATVEHEAELILAAPLPGGVLIRDLRGTALISARCFFAASDNWLLQQTSSDALGFPAPLDLLECTGEGPLCFGGAGAIIEIKVTDRCHCDTRRVIGWSGNLTVNPLENNQCVFSGSGLVWLQTMRDKTRPHNHPTEKQNFLFDTAPARSIDAAGGDSYTLK